MQTAPAKKINSRARASLPSMVLVSAAACSNPHAQSRQPLAEGDIRIGGADVQPRVQALILEAVRRQFYQGMLPV